MIQAACGNRYTNIKHHLNHGEEIGVKKLKTVKNSFVYGFLRRESPMINGCLVLNTLLFEKTTG